mgnify:CR=1 FL=1
MKIRTTIAVMAAKITGHVCKLMGRQGVTWAGKVAMKICPDILEELSSQVREKNICSMRNQWKDHNQ